MSLLTVLRNVLPIFQHVCKLRSLYKVVNKVFQRNLFECRNSVSWIGWPPKIRNHEMSHWWWHRGMVHVSSLINTHIFLPFTVTPYTNVKRIQTTCRGFYLLLERKILNKSLLLLVTKTHCLSGADILRLLTSWKHVNKYISMHTHTCTHTHINIKL